MKVRSMTGMRQRRCPCCGLRVVCDDATRTVHHENPSCKGFEQAMRELGLQAFTVEPTVFVSDKRGTS